GGPVRCTVKNPVDSRNAITKKASNIVTAREMRALALGQKDAIQNLALRAPDRAVDKQRLEYDGDEVGRNIGVVRSAGIVHEVVVDPVCGPGRKCGSDARSPREILVAGSAKPIRRWRGGLHAEETGRTVRRPDR